MRLVQRGLALGMAMVLALPGAAQQGDAGGSQDTGFVLRAESDLVLTNVVVRDAKTGTLVTGLGQSDFTVLEDGKAQRIASFDFESVDKAQPLNEATLSGIASAINNKSATGSVRPEELRNHRLIVFFFDLTSMQPEDVDRSVEAAKALSIAVHDHVIVGNGTWLSFRKEGLI